MRTLNNASKHARYRKVVVRGQLCLIIRQSALKQKKKNIEGLFSFVTTYHPVVQDLKKTLMANRSQIENRPLLKTIFKRPLIISYKRGKYLKAKLVTWRQLPDNASGGSRGGSWGAAPPPPLIFRPKWGPKGWKKNFCGRPPPPPYLRVWRSISSVAPRGEFGDHHDKSASNWGHNTVEPRYNECQGTDKIWFAITRFRYIRVYNGLLVRSKSFFIYFTNTWQWRIQGRGLGGPDPPPPISFRLNWGQKGSKKFFWVPGPPFSPGLLTASPPPPPYLKVWIRHFWERENRSLDRGSTQQRAFHHFLNATRKNQNNSRLERSCS